MKNWFQEILENSYLKGKRLVLGISGGIASYKSIELLRAFQKAGADVQVVLTDMARKFVGVETFEGLTGKKALLELSGMDHITVPHSADLFVVAPATANIIGKFANGICDTLLTTMLIASTCPIVIVPSMNWAMLKNPATQENIKKLRERGIIVVEPEEGDLACGEKGEGKFPAIEKIFFWCEYAVAEKKWKKGEKGENRKRKEIKVVITAGPTKEFIDDVRFISNPSSGFMGYAIAREIALQTEHSNIVLITGGEEFDADTFSKVEKVSSADEMYEKVKKHTPADIFFSTAAVSDFKPKRKTYGKIKKEGKDEIKIEFVRTTDILASTKDVKVKVGFSLEFERIEENARKKLVDKDLDLIVANSTDSFAKTKGEFIVLEREDRKGRKKDIGVMYLGEMSKIKLARILVEKAIDLLVKFR